MQYPLAQDSLRDIDVDPTVFTSFGAPPPNPDAINSNGGTRFGAIFGAVASAFRRSDDSASRKSEPKTTVLSPTKGPVVVTEPESEPRESAGSISTNSSDVQSLAQNPVATSSPMGQQPPKKFAYLFRKDPPISIGLNAKWASDDACHHCYACSLKFTTFLRRHHCRFCGRIFCSSCSAFRIPGQPFGAREGLRSCEVCYRETLRSLLETHYESLSEDMLQKIASLYAGIATSGNTNNQSFHQSQVSSSGTTPTIPGGSSSATGSGPNLNRSLIAASPRVVLPNETSSNMMVSSSPCVSGAPIVDDDSVVIDPLRGLADRRMTLDEIVVDNSYESGDETEDNGNQQARRREVLPQLSNLKQIFDSAFQPITGLKFETRRSLAKTFYHCFSGESFLRWLMTRDQELNSFQAAAIAKAMLDVSVIVPLQRSSNKEIFALSSYYRPGRAAGFLPIKTEQNGTDGTANKTDIRRSSSGPGNNTQNRRTTSTSARDTANSRSSNFGVASVATATKTNQMNVALDAAVGESLQKNFLIKEHPDEILPYRLSDIDASLRRLYKVHLSRLCSNLLSVDELDAEKWQRNLLQIVYHVIRIVKPRPRDFSDAIDIRRCVKIKKIYDSSLSANFEYIDGLVFTKSLAHRVMRASLHNPRFLLLQTGLFFERDCQQLTTLDVVVHQETEQMQRNVSQIASVKPTVLFCSGSIPTLACQQLASNEIVAASFVKPHILEQIARYTGAAILPSVDSLSLSGTGQQSAVRLGTCRTFSSFSVHMHSRLQKTFLCLSGCDPIGCTLLIRDGSYSDLIKVKRILKLLILAAYDGLVLQQYLIAFRANPRSFDLQPPYSNVNMNDEFTARLKTFDDDEKAETQNNRRKKTTSNADKRSKSATRKLPANSGNNKVVAKSDSFLAVLDLAIPTTSPKFTTKSKFDAAFSLATSGLLSLNPLIRLVDPLKKSALFEASESRIYFESPLFSLFAASYSQGKRPLAISNPAPPMWVSKCVPKPCDAFFTTPLIGGFDSKEVETMLSRFRREGFLFDIADDGSNAAQISQKNLSSLSEDKKSSKSSNGSGNAKCGAWVKPLSIYECQCLHVLTSTFSLDSQLSPFRHCDGPRLVSCPFHARSDLSLGAFLENQCFVPTTICPRRGCGAPLVDHVRRFSSNYGQVEIVVRPLAEPILSILALASPRLSDDGVSEFAESSLITWSMCRNCRCVTPFAEVTDDVWGMPLASYLHLKFYAVDFTCVPATPEGAVCDHSFCKFYLQFFAKGSLVAIVKFSSIRVHDLVIPPPTVNLDAKLPSHFEERHSALMKDHETLTQAIISHFDTVQAYLENCRNHLFFQAGANNPVSQPAIDLMVHSEDHLADERKLLITHMAALEVSITHPSWEKKPSSTLVRTTEQISFEIFQSVNQSWLDWNDRLRNLVRFIRTNSSTSVLSNEVVGEGPSNHTPLSSSLAGTTSPIPAIVEKDSGETSAGEANLTKEPPQPVIQQEQVSDQTQTISRPIVSQPAVTTSSSKPLGKVLDFLADSDVFKQAVFKTKLKLPLKSPFDPANHYVFRNQVFLFPIGVYDNEPSSLIAFALSTDEYNQKLQQLISLAPFSPSKESNKQDFHVNRVTNHSIVAPEINAVDTVDNENSNNGNNSIALGQSEDLDDEDDEAEEDATLKGDSQSNANSNVEDEDSTAIEFGSTLDPVDTISLRGVRPKIASRKPVLDSARFIAPRSDSSSAASSPNVERKSKISPPKNAGIINSASSISVNNTPSPRYLTPQPPNLPKDSPDAGKGEKTVQQQQELDPHIRISWTDAAANKESATKFSVTIYHASVFAEIRSLLVEKGDQEESDSRGWLETSYLRSLSRCVSWTTAGGKSGLRFFKTTDGRLILKQVSKEELKSIFKLAPDYASLLSSAREQNRPSTLVPILGVYNVSFDNGTTGKSNKFDVVVMTNLFRSYTISDKFDLKGSERNRFVKQHQQSDLESADSTERQPYEMVLMDENLLIRSLQDPLYVHPHSKQLLLQAISIDTQFLARNSVMDYSLLVGIDAERRCIVVGIIDYLRTFTFDKKLEYVVKSTGLLGGQGKAPTILYPGKYRERFLSAMRHFFLEVPDHWLAYETHNLRLASQG